MLEKISIWRCPSFSALSSLSLRRAMLEKISIWRGKRSEQIRPLADPTMPIASPSSSSFPRRSLSLSLSSRSLSVSSLSLERRRRRDARDREDLPVPHLLHSKSGKIAPTLIGGCCKSSDLVGESKLHVELVAGADVPELGGLVGAAGDEAEGRISRSAGSHRFYFGRIAYVSSDLTQ